MSGNLPDGTTTGDIDKHFGEPERERYAGVVFVGVEAEVPPEASKSEIHSALADQVDDERIVHTEIENKL